MLINEGSCPSMFSEGNTMPVFPVMTPFPPLTASVGPSVPETKSGEGGHACFVSDLRRNVSGFSHAIFAARFSKMTTLKYLGTKQKLTGVFSCSIDMAEETHKDKFICDTASKGTRWKKGRHMEDRVRTSNIDLMRMLGVT